MSASRCARKRKVCRSREIIAAGSKSAVTAVLAHIANVKADTGYLTGPGERVTLDLPEQFLGWIHRIPLSATHFLRAHHFTTLTRAVATLSPRWL